MDYFKSQLDRIQQQLGGLSASQKMLTASLVAIMVMTLVWWGRYAGDAEMSPVFDTSLGSIGVTVCSDLRFPEVYRVLTLRGARIIVCASAFLSPRLDHWEFFIRARAAENQVFVAASGQVGTEPISGISFVGRSMIADPWGTIIATASDVEGVVTAHLDLGLIDIMRDRYPLLDQRRPELYGEISRPVG